MLIGTALVEGKKRLAGGSETPALEAQALLVQVTGRTRAWVLAHPEAPLQSEALEAFSAGLARLEAGEPLAYVLGRREFYGLELVVSPAVLIPRPETELLVEVALEGLGRRFSAETGDPGRGTALAADVGTGSGCIAVALAVNLTGLRIVATDLSLPALRIARENARRHGALDRIDFVQSDLLSAFPQSPHSTYSWRSNRGVRFDYAQRTTAQFPERSRREGLFDLICANLPYIPTRTLAGLEVSRFEPRPALDGGADGLDLIRGLLLEAPRWLAPGGLALLEIEAGQGEAASALAHRAFPTAEIGVLKDLAGLDRVVAIHTRPGNKT